MAIGLGATTSIFSLLDAVLLRALPYPQAHELTEVWGSAQSEAVYLALTELDAFENLSATTSEPLTLNGDGEPLRVEGSRTTVEFFDTLAIRPIAGRAFLPNDVADGARDITVIAERLARSQFGSADAALGKTLRLEGKIFDVVGVVPDGVRLPNAKTQLWIPLAIRAADSGYHWGNYYLQLIGRLAEGVDRDAAAAQVRAAAGILRERNPIWTPDANYADTVTVQPLQSSLAGDLDRVLKVLMAAALAVLLVACVNVANLLLARSSTRERESSIRSSLGAGRARLLVSTMIESLVIAALGALFGLVVAFGSLKALTAALPAADARFGAIGVDLRVLGFTLAATVLTAILFGFAPAWRQSKAQLVAGLGAAARGGGSSTRRLTRALVVVQLALSLVLLFSAGLLLKSFWQLWNVDAGFDGDSVLAVRLDPADDDYRDHQQRIDFYRRVVDELRAAPQVAAAAAANSIPMGPSFRSAFEVPSLGITQDVGNLPFGLTRDVTPGYFDVIGLPLLLGRDFADTDVRKPCTQEDPCVSVVNLALAEPLFGDADSALGNIVGAYWFGYFEIVGVVANARLETLSSEPSMAIYLPHSQRTPSPLVSLQVVAKANADPMALESLIRETVARIDPQVAVDDVRTLSSEIEASVADSRFTTFLLSAFALVGLLLGGIGVYGVIAAMVEERRHELGVRAALGATPRTLRHQVLLQALMLALMGIGLGALGSLGATRLLEAQLYETSFVQPEIVIAVPLLLVVAAALAAWIPAKRAADLDPVETLRAD